MYCDLLVPLALVIGVFLIVLVGIVAAARPVVCEHGSHKETQDTVMWVGKSMLIIPQEVTVCNE